MIRRKDLLQSAKASLLVAREGQERRKASTVPLWEACVPQNSSKEQTLYLPDRRRAWVVDFSSSPPRGRTHMT